MQQLGDAFIKQYKVLDRQRTNAYVTLHTSSTTIALVGLAAVTGGGGGGGRLVAPK